MHAAFIAGNSTVAIGRAVTLNLFDIRIFFKNWKIKANVLFEYHHWFLKTCGGDSC